MPSFLSDFQVIFRVDVPRKRDLSSEEYEENFMEWVLFITQYNANTLENKCLQLQAVLFLWENIESS